MTRDELRSLLQSSYKRERWVAALPKLLPTIEVFRNARSLDFADEAITSAAQLARIPLADNRSVAVLEVRVSGQVDLQRNRVGLRNLVARFIGSPAADAVLAFFIGDSLDHLDYRFSFAARTNTFSADGQLEQNETAPRRYTYLFGPNQPCRTALERFELLRLLGARARLGDLIDAFKVEPLFKEFYHDYGRIFATVENHIRLTLADKELLRLFTQRLFNRLMFLAFVARKGWLRFGQRTDYLAALWNDYTAKRRISGTANFYADRLTPLFFEGLNQSDRATGSVDARFGSVPYLNGGLFEYAEDGTDHLKSLRVPDEALALILDPESGLFSRYNFTVAESTPLEIQVAVDPEMLGKVFEELVTGRHEQGSYYTPKPIVAFMGRTALVEYLVERCSSETRTSLEKFVHDDDASALRDPEIVHRALVDVKICDPACGSGAYLLGLLHELLDLRTRIFASHQRPDPESEYQRRLQIIERNLYGVDKDAFAVNIARLRLWLALAVEFEGLTPPPLPNLDFKIEVGDALAAPAPQDIFQRPAVEEFRDKKAAYLRAHGDEKAQLKVELDQIRTDLALWQHADLSGHGFNWAVEFAEVFLPDDEDRALIDELAVCENTPRGIVSGGFDIVVANPPYVRQELIKDQKPILKKRFPAVFSGVADLYVYFYARANELLRPGGVAAFISSNKWLRAGYGEMLRQHLLDAQAFALVMDFGELGVFDTVATDAAIFVWRKSARGEEGTRWAMVKDLQECYVEGVRPHFRRIAVEVPSSQFGTGKPRLATGATAGLRSKMESNAFRLGERYAHLMLNGVKSGLNDAFVISAAKRADLIKADRNSESIIKPFLEGDDVRRYEIEFRGRYLIYVRWDTDITKYPAIKAHLEEFESRLRKRDGVKNGGACPWFALSRPRPEAEKAFGRPKIIYPDIGKSLRFSVEQNGIFGSNTTYCIAEVDWYLLGVLNSAAVFQYLKGTCQLLGDEDDGGRLRFFGQYLETLPIPDASMADRKIVGELANKAQALHRQRRARSEEFIRALGLHPSDSTSRNPLEQPWALSAADYARRGRKLYGRTPDVALYEAARDDTAALTEQIAKVETEIDARVAGLYGLDTEDQRWAAQTAPIDDKQTLFFNVISKLKTGRTYFSTVAIQAAANDAELSLTDGSLKVYLSEAVSKGILHDAGRGWYSRLNEPVKLDEKKVTSLIRTVEKAFPLLDFVVWSTVQLNPWMHHILAHPVHFLYAPAETLDSIGEKLREQGWQISINPTPTDGPKSVRPGPKSVVLRPSVSKQPQGEAHQAPIEKILVDLVAETARLALMDASEADNVVESVLSRHLVPLAALQSYAERRGVTLAALETFHRRQSAASGSV